MPHSCFSEKSKVELGDAENTESCKDFTRDYADCVGLRCKWSRIFAAKSANDNV